MSASNLGLYLFFMKLFESLNPDFETDEFLFKKAILSRVGLAKEGNDSIYRKTYLSKVLQKTC